MYPFLQLNKAYTHKQKVDSSLQLFQPAFPAEVSESLLPCFIHNLNVSVTFQQFTIGIEEFYKTGKVILRGSIQ